MELWSKFDKELLETLKPLYSDETIPPYKIAKDLRSAGCEEPFIKKLILSLTYLRGKEFIISIHKSTNALRLKAVDWDEAFIRIPLPRHREGQDLSELARDDIYTTLAEHGFGEEMSQKISDSKIIEV